MPVADRPALLSVVQSVQQGQTVTAGNRSQHRMVPVLFRARVIAAPTRRMTAT